MPEDKPKTVEIVICFDYTLQRVPTRNNRTVQTRQDGTRVFLTLPVTALDANGVPIPRALWYAEGMFLKQLQDKHMPDVRVLHWQSRVDGTTKILSEYRVLLPASAD